MVKKLILKVIAGNHLGEEFIFEEQGAYIIGRSKCCALQIPNDQDMRISRQHLLLLFDSEKTRIRDLGSKNGTTLNETELPPGEITENPEEETPEDKILHPGDKVSIGNTEFLIELPAEPDEQTVPLVEDSASAQEKAPATITEPEEQIIPILEDIVPEPEEMPSPILLENIIKKSPMPSPVLEGEPTKEMPLPADAPQTLKGDPDDTPTLPIKTLPPKDVEKSAVILDKKPEENQAPIPHPAIPQKEKPVFEIKPKEVLKIKEKKPPVLVPTKLKVLSPETPKGNPSAQPPSRKILEPELPTIVMDQDELGNLKQIDDTKLQPPEKKRKVTFTVRPAEK